MAKQQPGRVTLDQETVDRLSRQLARFDDGRQGLGREQAARQLQGRVHTAPAGGEGSCLGRWAGGLPCLPRGGGSEPVLQWVVCRTANRSPRAAVMTRTYRLDHAC